MEGLNPKLAKFAEHLEWLGYSLQVVGNYLVATKSDYKTAFMISETTSSYLIAAIRYNLNKEIYNSNRIEALEIVNEINRHDLPKCTISSDEDNGVGLIITFLYYGDYNKSNFSSFVSDIEKGEGIILKEYYDKLKKFF